MCTLLVVPLPPVPLQPAEWAFLRSHSDAPTAQAGDGTVCECPQPQTCPCQSGTSQQGQPGFRFLWESQDVWPAPLPVGPWEPPLCPSPRALSPLPPWWPCIGHVASESCGSGCLSPQAFLLEHPKRGTQMSREAGLYAILGDNNLKSWSHE